ncbi:MAG: hypothetical protein WD250_01980 [Egibacteraceae bacterium]
MPGMLDGPMASLTGLHPHGAERADRLVTGPHEAVRTEAADQLVADPHEAVRTEAADQLVADPHEAVRAEAADQRVTDPHEAVRTAVARPTQRAWRLRAAPWGAR